MSRFVSLAFIGLLMAGNALADTPATPLPAPAPGVVPAPEKPIGTVPLLEEKTLRVLAPGIELSTVRRNIPGAPLQLFYARIDPKAGGDKLQWKLQVAPAGSSVLKAATVSEIARRENARVAINGGYFAFSGAALGAVKVGGEWLRLPWANRTAMAVAQNGGILIDNLEGNAQATLGQPAISITATSLNGFAAPDSVTILTPSFGTIYKLRADELAIEVADGKIKARVEAGSANIPAQGWTLVAHGAIRAVLAQALVGQPAQWKMNLPVTAPAAFQESPFVLGAGPRLVKGGEIFTTEKEENFRPDVIARGPRTAFGVDAGGRWIFLVCDGRAKDYSAGLSIPELAAEMQRAGAVEAICLDGGGSSAFVVDGVLTNKPSDGFERRVANALVIVPAQP